VTVDYQVAEGVMAYATISRGFRSGGINVGNIQGSTFDPEFVWNYEAGLKAQLLDRRLTANLAAFHYDYTDLQLYLTRTQTGIVENAAEATINGLELELTALPAEGLRLELASSYVDATFDKYVTVEPWRPQNGPVDFSGNRLARAPKVKVNAAAEKSWTLSGGEASLRAEYAYTSTVYFNEFNRPEARQGPIGLWNARASFTTDDGRYRVTAFVENIADKFYLTDTVVGSAGTNFTVFAYPAPPRTYGLQLSAKF
jgi:iron complex outermembrane receptor protein